MMGALCAARLAVGALREPHQRSAHADVMGDTDAKARRGPRERRRRSGPGGATAAANPATYEAFFTSNG
jgi:hypothetical protein